MEMLDKENSFNLDLIDAGSEEVEKEGGFYSSLKKAISEGLISAIETLVSKNGMFNSIIENLQNDNRSSSIPQKNTDKKDIENIKDVNDAGECIKKEKRKGIIGKILDSIIDFFKGNKEKEKAASQPTKTGDKQKDNQNSGIGGIKKNRSLEEGNTLLSNQNIEIRELKRENETLKSQVSDNKRWLKVMEMLLKQMENNEIKQVHQDNKVIKAVGTEERNLIKN